MADLPNDLPPLHVHLLFHPESDRGRRLALGIMAEWMPRPGAAGLRIPIFLTPDRGDGLPPDRFDLSGARHSVVVVLIDAQMARKATGQGRQWATFTKDLMARLPAGGPHVVMPAFLDEQALRLDPDISAFNGPTPFKQANGDPHTFEGMQAALSLRIALQALDLLRAERAPDAQRKAKVVLFLSHAKADLDKDYQDPVHLTQDALRDLPVREWFDSKDIADAARFGPQIDEGVRGSDAVIVFMTDSWATRPWCLAEALTAKRFGTPTLIVDALEEGEARHFPYGGNTRLIRWRHPLRPEPGASGDQLTAWQAASRAEGWRVVAAGVNEALRREHTLQLLAGFRGKRGQVVLDAPPEPARVVWERDAECFLYPDPPVGRLEQQLLTTLHPTTPFETPLMRFARLRPQGRDLGEQGPPLIAVSASESPDLAARGLTDAHQHLLIDETHLYLLAAGLRVVFGGRLEADKPNDGNNFTWRLIDLVASYSALAGDAGTQLRPILNLAPWPTWTTYDAALDDDLADFAAIERLPLPDLGVSEEAIGLHADAQGGPDTPLQVYARARALTEMREKVTAMAVARVCLGGRLEGGQGLLPGLIEEAYIQLKERRPLFIVGGLGGCAQAIVDLLEDRVPPELTTAAARRSIPHYDAIVDCYRQHGGELRSREEIAAEIKALGANGPAAALNNGLTDDENRTLFKTTDPARIAELILTGLERKGL